MDTLHEKNLALFPERLMESARFHTGGGNVHATLRELVPDLDRVGIDYATIGAMALNAHGFARETTDVNVLVAPEGLKRLQQTLGASE